jgi:hypothetical protein
MMITGPPPKFHGTRDNLGDAEQIDAPVRDPGQQVDDVIVVDEGVGHLDQ